MKKITLLVFFIVTIITLSNILKAWSASTQVVDVYGMASDCSSTYLKDAAGTLMGPYTNATASQRLQQAIQQRAALAEAISQQDAKIAASEIALGGFQTCYASLPPAPPVLTTNVNWDAVDALLVQGVNWSSVQSNFSGINWQAVNLSLGINWSSINWNRVNWASWPTAESQGQNWKTFIQSSQG